MARSHLCNLCGIPVRCPYTKRICKKKIKIGKSIYGCVACRKRKYASDQIPAWRVSQYLNEASNGGLNAAGS